MDVACACKVYANPRSKSCVTLNATVKAVSMVYRHYRYHYGAAICIYGIEQVYMYCGEVLFVV